MKYFCFFDGGCWPNPGGAMGAGVHITNQDGEIVYEHSGDVNAYDSNTNNVAEYIAFMNCLNWLLSNANPNDEALISGDSNLVIMQMLGKWRIKNGAYVDYALESRRLLSTVLDLISIELKWIPREDNEIADSLASKSLPKLPSAFLPKSLKERAISAIVVLPNDCDISQIRSAISRTNTKYKNHISLYNTKE